MRPLVILLCLALLVPMPSVTASHRGVPTMQGTATTGGLNLTLAHEGSASGSGTKHTDGERYRSDATFDFSYSYKWNTTVKLHAPSQPKLDSPDLEAYATVTFSETGNVRESYRMEQFKQGVFSFDGDYVGTCSIRDEAPRQALVRAVFLPERGSILVSIPYLGHNAQGRWTCQEKENNYASQMSPDAAPLATDAFAPDVRRLHSLINGTTAARLGLPEQWGESADGDIGEMVQHAIAEFPFALAPAFQERARTLQLPVTDPQEDRGRYCVEPTFGTVVTCKWSATVDWQLDLDPCPPTRESLAEHMDRLRAHPAPDASKGLASLLAWKDAVTTKTGDVMGDARTLALLCGDENAAGHGIALIAARVLEYQRALLQLFKKGDRSPELVQAIFAAERNLQLSGYEGDAAFTEVVAAVIDASQPPQGEVTVSVHSPVSIHVWNGTGAHVGWNATTDAPEIGIPGARYEGRPGQAQTIRLPAGVYRVSADELSAGAYTLEVSWEAEGAHGSEAFPLDAREGRTFVTHYALVGAAKGAEMERYPAARIDTPAHFAFMDAPPKSVPDLASFSAPSTKHSGDAAGARSPVPVSPALVGLALVVAALLTSRPARR